MGQSTGFSIAMCNYWRVQSNPKGLMKCQVFSSQFWCSWVLSRWFTPKFSGFFEPLLWVFLLIFDWMFYWIFTTLWLFNSSPWKIIMLLSSLNHLFLWAIQTILYHGYVTNNQMVNLLVFRVIFLAPPSALMSPRMAESRR